MDWWETQIVALANFIQLILETGSIFVVAAGAIAFIVVLFSGKPKATEPKARLVLGRYLIVALELQLCADIIATATDPSIEELAKLTAIAVIRTFLNYFLLRELRAEKEREAAT